MSDFTVICCHSDEITWILTSRLGINRISVLEFDDDFIGTDEAPVGGEEGLTIQVLFCTHTHTQMLMMMMMVHSGSCESVGCIAKELTAQSSYHQDEARTCQRCCPSLWRGPIGCQGRRL